MHYRCHVWRQINTEAIGVEGARELVARRDIKVAFEERNTACDGEILAVVFGLSLGEEAHGFAWNERGLGF
jgi:hypothetical protein